jgi:hypothetical protein
MCRIPNCKREVGQRYAKRGMNPTGRANREGHRDIGTHGSYALARSRATSSWAWLVTSIEGARARTTTSEVSEKFR